MTTSPSSFRRPRGVRLKVSTGSIRLTELYQAEEDGGLITTVTWSGGEIGPREFQQFLVQAQAPDEPGEYPWNAVQTYEDGSVAEWTGPADAEEPAPVVS